MKINSFNPVAQAYTEKVSPRRFNQFLAITNELQLKGNERVLDIGAGPGILSLEIARRLNPEGSLIGIDLAPDMIELALKNLEKSGFDNVEFKLGDALKLDFPDNSFDVIVSSNAYPWVPDREQFLKEVRRVLRPGGKFTLVALSNDCYKEFSSALKQISEDFEGLFPINDPFEIMGAKLHAIDELAKAVQKAEFEVINNFKLSTEEIISAQGYIERVNAIVNENYLDHLDSVTNKLKLRDLILQLLTSRNGNLVITESSVFVTAIKK